MLIPLFEYHQILCIPKSLSAENAAHIITKTITPAIKKMAWLLLRLCNDSPGIDVDLLLFKLLQNVKIDFDFSHMVDNVSTMCDTIEDIPLHHRCTPYCL